jgi:hypothetical protein
VVGVVLTRSNSEPIANAKVSVNNQNASVQTNADGSFTLKDLSTSAPAVLRVQAAGFVDGVISVSPTAGAAKRASLRLVRASSASSINPAVATTVTVANSSAQVALPANSLINAAGAPATGKVSAQVTPIDPAADPLSMPGNYTTSANERIESFGAINVVLKDESGAALNLKPGSSATVRIPVSSLSTSPPPSIPLFYLNETTGLWVQEGSATLTGTVPNQYYEGAVTHFSTWNADSVQDTIFVNGCVNDINGKPLVAAEVSSIGIDYSGAASAETDAQGKFRVGIRKASRASIFAESGNLSNTVVAGPSLVDITLPACLVIGGAPVAPTILEQPASFVTPPLSFAFFHVVANGTRPLKYQWLRNGVPIAGQTFEYLFLFGDDVANGDAVYKVVVSNSAGTVTSAEAKLSVVTPTPAAPNIVMQPTNTSAAVGSSATFTVIANGFPAPSYQWRRNGVDIAGATKASYTTPAVTTADAGSAFSVLISNSLGNAVSNIATLTIGSGPTLTDKENLLQLVNLSFNFYYASAAPLNFIGDNGDNGDKFLSSSAVCKSGTASAMLNGSPVVADQTAPLTGTLAATFADCDANGSIYSGSSSVAYAFDSSLVANGSSTTTANNMRLRVNAGTAVLQDLTADGVSTLTLKTTANGADSSTEIRLSQSTGSTLRNEISGVTATFNSGSVTLKSVQTNNTATKQVIYTYDNLNFNVSGVNYVAQGSYQYDFAAAGSTNPITTGSGEVILSSNGVRVGRIFFDANGVFSTEVDGVIKPVS